MDAKSGQDDRSFETEINAITSRLRSRRKDIEQAVVRACLHHEKEPEKVAGLQSAASEVTAYFLQRIEYEESALVPVPSAAVSQVRRAAREEINLDTIVMGLMTGYELLNEFILRDTRECSRHTLYRIQARQTAALKQLISVLVREHKEEAEHKSGSSLQRTTINIRRLLLGAPLTESELDYQFNHWHIGALVMGQRGMSAISVLGEILGVEVMAVPCNGETVWAWLGSSQRLPICRVQKALLSKRTFNVRFALGEPRIGVNGWRSTHFEAQAAFAVAIRSDRTVTYFSQVALEAIALQSPDLARSLHATYLGPLAERGRKGETLRQTLKAYFSARRNVASAAAALKVSRRTVENRLRAIEKALNRPLDGCKAELEVALRLEALGLELNDTTSK